LTTPPPEPSAVAAFDFDGTLTRADTLMPFLQRLCGTRALVRTLAAELGSLTLALARLGDREEAKAAVLARLLAGRRVDEVTEVVDRYAQRVISRQLRPAVVARTRWHRDRGHQLVVVSASPELYVRPMAERLGFDDVLATRLEIADGRLTGRLVGANVQGSEKVHRLRAWLAGRDAEVWAYGNSSGDRAMLAFADHPFFVTRRGVVQDGPAARRRDRKRAQAGE
jgi:phosphatidylglycerophosphatase C